MSVEQARVLITRPAGRAEVLRELLADADIQADSCPFIDLKLAPEDERAKVSREAASGGFAWVALTSKTAVDALDFSWFARPNRWQPPHGKVGSDGKIATHMGTLPRIAAVGGATARAAERAGLSVALTGLGSAQALCEVFPPPAHPDEKVLLPTSAKAAYTLHDGLRALGYMVIRRHVYDTVPAEVPQPVLDRLRKGEYSAVVLTSGTAAQRLHALCPASTIRTIVIGEATKASAEALGLTVAAMASRPTDDALATAVREVVAHG